MFYKYISLTSFCLLFLGNIRFRMLEFESHEAILILYGALSCILSDFDNRVPFWYSYCYFFFLLFCAVMWSVH